jgi:hypothetical protein
MVLRFWPFFLHNYLNIYDNQKVLFSEHSYHHLTLSVCSPDLYSPEVSFIAYGLSYYYLTVLFVEFSGFSAISQPKIVASDFWKLCCACITKTRVMRVMRYLVKKSNGNCRFYRWSMETRLKAVFFFVFFHFGLSMLPQGVLIAFTIIIYHVDHFCTAFNMVLGQYLPNITLISTVLAVFRAAKNRTRTGQEPDKNRTRSLSGMV